MTVLTTPGREPRRGDGEEREEEEADAAGDEHGVPEQPVAVAALTEEHDRQATITGQ